MGECIRCGQCCTCAYVWMGTIKIDDDTQEFARWLSYHGCQPKRFRMNDEPDSLGIKIPIVCKHLNYDKGIASCRIYEKRPKICMDYKCERIKVDDDGVVKSV